MPMLINTQRGQWALSQRGVRNHWPALLQDYRLSGNSQLDPLVRFASSFQTINDINTEPWAWEYLASRLARLQKQDRHRYQPVVTGFDLDNPLYVLFQNAIEEIKFGNDVVGLEDLEDALSIFSRVCTLLGELRDRYDRRHGFGPGIYMEIVEMARLCAPIVAEVDYQYDVMNRFGYNISFYSMLRSVGEMCKEDVQTMERVINTLPVITYQQDIFAEALSDWQNYGSLHGRVVIYVITGI